MIADRASWRSIVHTPQRIVSNVDCNASLNMRQLSAKKGANSQKLKIANIIGMT